MSEAIAIPKEIATCPECSAKLWCVVESADSIDVSCEAWSEWCNDMLESDGDDMATDFVPHLHYQSEWQPIYDRVNAWLLESEQRAETKP